MVKFVCTKCNYRFEAETSKSCPYCSEENIDREKSAAELISEVSDILNE